MSALTEFSRLLLKQSADTGVVGTIPASNDHTDGSWLETDLYIGEGLLNTADDILYIRTDNGIKEIAAGDGDSEIFTKSVVVPSASVLSLFSLPVELIGSDADGRAIEVMSAIVDVAFVSTAYTAFFNLRILCSSAQIAQLNETQALRSTRVRSIKFVQSEIAVAPDEEQIVPGDPIVLACDGDPLTGTSDITVHLVYRYITS